MNRWPTTVVTRLGADRAQALDTVAAEHGHSRSAEARIAIEFYLGAMADQDEGPALATPSLPGEKVEASRDRP
jgi:plasmid stability protein